ncbi:LysR substrate-binding domain-containing protein [Ferrimonas senticii]|uniref:LysR substrate-binding domain-containing protein n=1 Tax=Ferrimonas senticii TaxID=394566 RepID=UPI0003FD736E|nr:LysR substrate-binding domain-containing protein [Ferrimonas senticii]
MVKLIPITAPKKEAEDEPQTGKFSLKQLAVFDAVATHGTVSAAADALALTQSATSMALAHLERSLGSPLFERQSKRMLLTAKGHWLRPKVKEVLQDIKLIEAGFAEQQILSGEIKVAVSQTPAEHLFPAVIRNLDADYPALRIDMTVKNTDMVIEGIRNYEYDLGVIESHCLDDSIAQQVWCHDTLTIVASKDHPYAKFQRVSFAQLEQAQWVLRERGSGIRTMFETAIFDHIDKLHVWREYEHVGVIKDLVQHNQYLTCLPWFDVRYEVERGDLVQLAVPALNMKRSLNFIWRADAIDNPLRECIKSEAIKLTRVIEPELSH